MDSIGFVPLPIASPHRGSIERLLECEAIEVRSRGFLPHGNCYWNIDGLVRSFGGSMVLGWILLWWPGRLVEAMHHAVWRKPSGELFDPSKRPEDDERDSVLFCEDSALKIDLKMPLYIPSRRLLLSGHKALANLVDLLDRELNLAREITMQARSDGAVFVSGQPLRVTLSGEAAKNMRKLQRARRLAFAQCAALSEAELNPQGSQHSDR